MSQGAVFLYTVSIDQTGIQKENTERLLRNPLTVANVRPRGMIVVYKYDTVILGYVEMAELNFGSVIIGGRSLEVKGHSTQN